MSVRILFSLCFYCFCCVAIGGEAATSLQEQRVALMNDAQAGSFILSDGQAASLGVLLGTEVDVQISGPVASIQYSQTFLNEGQSFVEGTYVFPLPENAAVHAMSIEVGERHIEGEIKTVKGVNPFNLPT